MTGPGGSLLASLPPMLMALALPCSWTTDMCAGFEEGGTLQGLM